MPRDEISLETWPFFLSGAAVLLVAGPLLLLASTLYGLFFHPLSKVPGPKLYAVSQLPFLYHLIKGDWHLRLKEFHDIYGPVVRFSPKDVSFNSVEAMQQIYGNKIAVEQTYEKDFTFYQKRRPAASAFVTTKLDHRRQRRLLAHAFSMKALNNQEGVLKQYTKLFIKNVGEHAKKHQGIVDILRWYNFTTFDLIGDLAFGSSFECLNSGGYHPWVRIILENIKSFAYLQALIRLNLQSTASMLLPASLKKSAEEHHEMSSRIAMKRLESKDTTREDFMSYILRYNDDRGLSMEEIAENANLIILAGSETTASFLSGVTYYLLRNQDVYDTLVKEIRESFDNEDDITLARVGQLNYLAAVLNEGLRMYPPAPASLPRVIPAGGDVVNGYWLPENTVVSTSHWTLFRSETNFRDSDSFIPARWLNDPRYADDNKEIFQPFSVGPRNCVGQNLANAEMRLILTHLLWKFDLELTPESENWSDHKVYLLWEKQDLNVKLIEVIRETKSEA